ncbi:MAG: hypothetical protein RL562_3471 [Planctomycetota bacterium]
MLRAVTALLAGIVAATAVGCRGEGEAPTEAPGYVGAARCATCHPLEHASWQGSHHDLAMQEATSATVLGSFDAAPFEHGGITTSFRRDGDRHFITTDGPDGTPQEFEVRYAFGVEPLQQYLVDIGKGRLQALQVAWDSRPAAQGGQRWFHLYPDAHAPAGDPMHWTGPAMNWNFMCASCHSTDVRRGYTLDTDTYETTWSEIDVGCESCHGPGSHHVTQAEAQDFDEAFGLPAKLDGPAPWVLGPGETIARRATPFEGHAEVETCAPCHARRAQVTEEPWPGSPLLDHYQPSLLEDGLYHADGQILDEVYVYGSFAQSRMHAAGVTCSDCHDPHSLRLRAEGNALCARCHLPTAYDTPTHHHHEPGTAGASCVACHMPEKTYMVVDPRRDHSMRVPRPDLTVAIGTPNACQDCHADRGARWAADAVRDWLGAPPAETHATRVARALHAARSGRPGTVQTLAALAVDPEASGIARATAVALLDGAPGGTDPAALTRAAGDADPLVRAAAARALMGLAPEQRASIGAPLLRDPVRTVRADAGRALAHVPGLSPDQQKQRDAALEEWIAFQATNRDQPWAHVNLGLLHQENGDETAAEKSYREALRIGPHAVQARVNLADLLRARDRDDLGEALLRQGLDAIPDSAELRHTLGLLLVRRGKTDEALTLLEQAARERPDNARFAYVHAVAVESVAGRPRAVEIALRALETHAWDPDLLLAVATWLREDGEIARALPFAERLVRVVPEAQPLLDELRAAGR